MEECKTIQTIKDIKPWVPQGQSKLGIIKTLGYLWVVWILRPVCSLVGKNGGRSFRTATLLIRPGLLERVTEMTLTDIWLENQRRSQRERMEQKLWPLSQSHCAAFPLAPTSLNPYITLSASGFKNIQIPGSNLLLKFNCTINIICIF